VESIQVNISVISHYVTRALCYHYVIDNWTRISNL
jgi:hypothetical protein